MQNKHRIFFTLRWTNFRGGGGGPPVGPKDQLFPFFFWRLPLSTSGVMLVIHYESCKGLAFKEQKGKNFVSDGHFCTSNFKRCHHIITYLDCVMSKCCLDLQNQCLRNQVIKAASVMELKTTRLKNGWAKKILLPNWPSGTIFNNMRY